MATKRKADVLEESPSNGFYIKYMPKKDMTGVDASMTRLCAAVSGQIYSSSKMSDFNLSTNDIEAKVIYFEDHGETFDGVTPNMVVVVTGTTMILGWQGSTTVSDFVTDFHLVPITSSRWSSHVSKQIKVHGGFLSVIENDLSCLESDLIEMMKEHKITEIITTGHSLAGAMAQVAQLCIQAELSKENSVWSEYKKNNELIVRSVQFSAPMSISTIASAVTSETKKFLDEIATKSCNIIYHMDIVPRGFSQLDFIGDVIENAIDGIDDSEVYNKFKVPGALSIVFKLSEFAKASFEEAKKSPSLQNILKVARTYNHYCNIIYYDNDSSEPVGYRDYNHDESSDYEKFSDLKYVPQEKGMNIVGNLGHDHNMTVRGPGLAYNIPDDKLAGKCYMMDEFEILRNHNDIGHDPPITFVDFNDCVKKAKEHMHTSSHAAVAVWSKEAQGKDKFKFPGTLYIKENVPGNSKNASADQPNFWDRGIKYKATFWRSGALDDWVTKKAPAADIHHGVVELQ